MLSEDYVMRMIRQFAAALARIIGLKKAGDLQEALQEIDQSLEQILGLEKEVIQLLDDESVYRILTKNDQIDLERLEILADLFKEEGDIFNLKDQKTASNQSYIRALTYYLLISFNQDPSRPSALSQKIKEIIRNLGENDLTNEMLFDLFCYYENSGEYANAEKILDTLANRPEVESDVRGEKRSFYLRLLEMDPKELNVGGSSRQEIISKLKDIN